CLQACTLGVPPALERKCHGRPDVACTAVDSLTSAYCLPHCRADLECGASRFCDHALGLCVKTKPVGDPVGTPCDPQATTKTCLAVCLRTSADGVTPAIGVCAELCSAGSGCMYDDAGNPGGGCFGQLTAAFGPLDLGYCSPSCSCTSDCPADLGNKCRAWTSAEAEYKDALGKPGLCFDSIEGSQELACN
ncbi:MAG TPA: hypothetical protein VJV79_35795, partial [Polyangiaceae bacterium]|nr:hypothetical protein [Polyangiaceae bacterium]